MRKSWSRLIAARRCTTLAALRPWLRNSKCVECSGECYAHSGAAPDHQMGYTMKMRHIENVSGWVN